METSITETFKKIYGEYSDSIFRFCLSRVSAREQALDLTQETFLRLWQTLLEEKPIKNQRAFLFTVAHRLIIDWYRKKKSYSLDKMMGEENSFFDPPDEKSTRQVELGAEGRYILEKINSLSDSNRDALYLRFVEDLSPEEIGKILGISANAASVRINRGLEELRKLMGYNSKK